MKLTTLRYLYFHYFSNLLIIVGFLLVTFPFLPVIRDEIWYFWRQKLGQNYELSLNTQSQRESVFASLLTPGSKPLFPINKDFSIMIEKIGVNAPVIRDVSVTNEESYNDALKDGVAHASLSDYPSMEPGNVYLFAHASVNFWDLGKYATVFNLLRKLDLNDSIYVFYNNQKYEYRVVNKETYSGWNTYPITRPVIEPTLTLQTCDPPGTTLNRLVVTANLKSVTPL